MTNRGSYGASIETRLDRLSMPVTECGCWVWLGRANDDGYGEFYHDGKVHKAHRMSWMARKGPIPPGKQVLHSCDNTFCINPDHLFVGTQIDNMRDMATKKRGRVSRGEANAMAILTEGQVREIRATSGDAADIAARYGVARHVIYQIRSRKTWKHI